MNKNESYECIFIFLNAIQFLVLFKKSTLLKNRKFQIRNKFIEYEKDLIFKNFIDVKNKILDFLT